MRLFKKSKKSTYVTKFKSGKYYYSENNLSKDKFIMHYKGKRKQKSDSSFYEIEYYSLLNLKTKELTFNKSCDKFNWKPAADTHVELHKKYVKLNLCK